MWLWGVVIVILLGAALLRFYRLPLIPPGLNFDEAGNGVAALDILNGAPKLWWRIGGGKEPLWPYIISMTTGVLGFSPLALRLPAAFIGLLTVAVMVPLGNTLFQRGSRSNISSIGILTMAGVAFSVWHIHFSRLGFRAVLLPFLSALVILFFWKGWRSGKIGYSLLTAALLALSIYSYLAARMLPLVLMAFIVVRSLSLDGRQRLFLGRMALYLLLFLLPLLIYFAIYPADLLARSAAVSIFNPAWNGGDLAGTVWRTLMATLGTFVGGSGDQNPLVNIPGVPAVPWVLVPFFVTGIGVAGWQTVRLVTRQMHLGEPYLLLLLWWGIMLLPAMLAPEGAPHHLRLIGALVPTYIFIALGVAVVTNWVVTRLSRWGATAYLLPGVIFLFIGVQSFQHYFVRWPDSADFELPFDLYALRLADQIENASPDTVFVLPMDIRAGSEARHYTLDYLLAGSDARWYYLPVDEWNVERVLNQVAAQGQQIKVVRWNADKHHQADARELLTYLLQTNATLNGVEAFPVYSVESYSLNSAAPTFTLPAISRPVGAQFDDQLRLDAVYLPDRWPVGTALPVAITVAPVGRVDSDYKVSLRLTDGDGARVLQKDRVLLHTFHQGTSLWPPESVNEYYLLSQPPDLSPGAYSVSLVIYHPETLAPLITDGQAELIRG
jgi:hypothetical protein